MAAGRQQQEMVERGDKASSPFWAKSRQSPVRQSSSQSDSSKVIGAAYSHADMLKMDSLSLGSSSRPQTPPRNEGPSPSRTPPARPTQFQPPGSRKSYSGLSREVNKAWDVGLDDEDDEDEEELAFDEDEDEFGLPSLATMRRKKSAPRANGHKASGDSIRFNTINKMAAAYPGPSRVDSGDISEERGLPSYPLAGSSRGKILRPQYKEILRDPANFLHLIDHPTLPTSATTKDAQDHSSRITRINKFKRILQASTISMSELRNAAWSGLPQEVRAMSWQVLLGYLPTSSERRVGTLERRRREYLEGIQQAFEKGTSGLQSSGAGADSSAYGYKGRARGLDEAIWHQISIDVPRTSPHLPLYQFEATQRSLERILYLWAIRHPASGYVQGINDLVTPFWQVFLGSYITDPNVAFGMDPGQLPKPVLDAVEADSFWCLSKLLDGIQDNYVHAQPGIQRQVASLRDLTKRIDAGLVNHFESEGIEFMQFSFRWMNCLLMREVSVENVIRMWDTYLSEEQGFSDFHLYVCAAFLVKWSDQLIKMDFQEIMVFLQALPTREWTAKDIELLLSEAFIWQSLFRGSSAHLKDSGSRNASGLSLGT